MDLTTQSIPTQSQAIAESGGYVSKGWRSFFLYLWKLLGSGREYTTAVSGDMKVSASGEPQPGWLFCNGAAVSRTEQAGLFKKIGTAYGVGDGVTTFNIPDLRDRVILGAGFVFALGDTGGAAAVTLTVAQLPPHTHTDGLAGGSAGAGAGGDGAVAGDTGSTGDGDPVPILPPFVAMNHYIKT